MTSYLRKEPFISTIFTNPIFIKKAIFRFSGILWRKIIKKKKIRNHSWLMGLRIRSKLYTLLAVMPFQIRFHIPIFEEKRLNLSPFRKWFSWVCLQSHQQCVSQKNKFLIYNFIAEVESRMLLITENIIILTNHPMPPCATENLNRSRYNVSRPRTYWSPFASFWSQTPYFP